VELWETSNLRPLRLGEEKKKEEERRNHRMKIYSVMVCPIPQGGHKNHRANI